MTTRTIRKYNPGFLTDAALVDMFCVRQFELESLLDTLRGCTGPANQPQIVIGPRGSGKTTLLLRVAAELRRDPELSARFFPVVFAEESYEVSKAGEFWLECLSQLADQATSGPDDPDLRRTAEALRGDLDDRSLADRCLGALLGFAHREDRRLVLFVENLDMLFRDMADRDAGWRLRKVLQTEPRIVLIASATTRFDEMDHPAHAFYDMFQVHVLRRLDTAECTALWESVSGRRGERPTIRSLEILTGGSPRLVAIVARFGAGRSFRHLMDELLDLVDDHTEYFKSHLEILAPQERRVYLALAALWKPATTREIAARCRLGTSQCSAQLRRLKKRDFVEERGGTARRKEYYLAERLHNIYYLLRRRRGQAPLVEALVEFMRLCYPPSELAALAARMRRETRAMDPRMRKMVRTAPARLRGSRGAREKAVRLFHRGVDLRERHQPEEALSAWDDLVRRFGDTEDPEFREPVAAALASQVSVLGSMNRPADASAVADRLVDRFGESESPVLQRHVAPSLVNRGTALAELGRLDDAMEAWERVRHRFGASEDPDLQEAVAMALVNRAGGLCLLHRLANAVTLLDTVVRRFGDSEHPAVRLVVATALVSKGAALLGAERLEGAVAAWEEVVRRFGESEDPGLRRQAAKALVNQGVALAQLGRTEEALSAWEDAGHRYGADEDPELLDSVVKAVENRGRTLNRMGREEETVAACDRMLGRPGNGEASRTVAVRVLPLKGSALQRMGRERDALAAYGEVIQRVEDGELPDVEQWKHQALLGKADVHLKGGRYAAVIKTTTLVLGDGHAIAAELRWRAHAIRAHAALLEPDLAGAVRDLEELLKILAAWDAPPSEALQSLLILAAGIGPEPMIRLIEASPAKDLLLPVSTALHWELGRRPRVSLEVEEVARDIRTELNELRGGASAAAA